MSFILYSLYIDFYIFLILFLFQISPCTLPLSYSILPPPSFFYFCFKFYFPSFYAFFLFLTLIVFPPFIPSKSYFFFHLLTSHSFSLYYNILIFFLPLLITAVWHGYCYYGCFYSILFLFVHYFFISDLIG